MEESCWDISQTPKDPLEEKCIQSHFWYSVRVRKVPFGTFGKYVELTELGLKSFCKRATCIRPQGILCDHLASLSLL